MKKILIVDDEPRNLHLLREILQPEGYKLLFAKSGKEALECSFEQQPDLILLDVMMPKMNGYEVCRRLQANPETAKIQVIFVSAMRDIDDETLGFDVGAVDYITKPISAPIVRRRVATQLQLVSVDELNELARSAIRMLGEAGHYNDTDTGDHIWRMARYSCALAEAGGWESDQIKILELAAPMHDTGKVAIPDSILKAPRKLTPVEWKIMMTHSKIGADILSMSKNPVFVMATDIALNHHEKWDGTGYPNGVSGEDIPEPARIVAIADVFDALTSKRPYKEPWSAADAMAEIRKCSGSHLDPRLVDHFLENEGKILKLRSISN